VVLSSSGPTPPVTDAPGLRPVDELVVRRRFRPMRFVDGWGIVTRRPTVTSRACVARSTSRATTILGSRPSASGASTARSWSRSWTWCTRRPPT
jgi:hypothetical protein